MPTVRVSPTEVQYDAMVYTFADASAADRFFASGMPTGVPTLPMEPGMIRCRPIDCDHEIGGFPE